MEFCSQNLRNIVEVKPQVFGRQSGEAMDCVENGRFIKLCDFGLAVEHQRVSQSHSKHKGTPKYMAPDLDQSNSTQFRRFGANPKRVSSSISRNTESNVSTGSIRSIREKFEKLSQNSKTEK
ncbi:unnamed protein product [Oppiella nova]|uniref:Protein kinase domain-containing protein n=1 Tax=Oppiella nova TaxID=334625 RepID=A0A7R9QM71_9ACAR|nr:unnamed protein product [Oppiella nova]CAG2168352.1 unnamed protein product [Oppiella nova]